MDKSIVRRTSILVAALMFTTVAGSFPAQAYGAEKEAQAAVSTAVEQASLVKNETVYVKLSPEGKVVDTTVVNWFHTNGKTPEKISDPADLKKPQVLNGSFKARQGKDSIELSKLSSKQKDYYYSGVSDRALPVSIQMTYFLNGKAVQPKDLKGKSGDVEIRIHVKNETGQSQTLQYQGAGGQMKNSSKTIYTPFMTMVSVDLPARQFSNVDAGEDGIVTALGETYKVNWVLFPYPEQDVALHVNAEDFTLNSMNIVVQPKMPPIPDIGGTEQLQELQKGIGQMDEAMGQLEKGSGELAEGQGRIRDGVQRLGQGLGQLKALQTAQIKLVQIADGINQQLSGALQPAAQNPMLGNAVQPVLQGLEKQHYLLTALLNGGDLDGQSLPPMTAGIEGVDKAQQGMDQLAQGVNASEQGARQLHQGIQRVRTEGLGQMQSGVNSTLEEVNMGKAQIKAMENRVNAYNTFAGKSPSVEGHVQFVMQTQEIK